MGWCGSPAYASTEKPQPGSGGRRGGVFISHEVVHQAVPGSAEAEGAAGALPRALPGASCAISLPGCVSALFHLQRFSPFFSALSNAWEEAFHSFSLSLPQHNGGNGCVKSSSVGLHGVCWDRRRRSPGSRAGDAGLGRRDAGLQPWARRKAHTCEPRGAASPGRRAPGVPSSLHGSSCSARCVWAAAWLCHMPETARWHPSHLQHGRGRGSGPRAGCAPAPGTISPRARGLWAQQPHLSLQE